MTIPGWQGAPYQPAPPPAKSHTLRTVLIVVGVVLVLCCGGGIIGGVFLFHGLSKATAPAEDAADEFVTDLQNGDTAGAYQLLCSGTQGAFTPAAFAQGVAAQPTISSHEMDGVNVVTSNGHSSATVTVKLTTGSGFVDEHAFPLVKEGGRWKVCGQPY
jgi:Domain of unknown function (DUF4878)